MGFRVNRSEHIYIIRKILKKKKLVKEAQKKKKKEIIRARKEEKQKRTPSKTTGKKKLPTDFRRTNQFHAGEAFHYFSFFPSEIERGRIHKSDLNH